MSKKNQIKKRTVVDQKIRDLFNHPYLKAHDSAGQLLALMWKLASLPSLPIPKGVFDNDQWEREKPDWGKWTNYFTTKGDLYEHSGQQAIHDCMTKCKETMQGVWDVIVNSREKEPYPGWKIQAAAALARAWSLISFPFGRTIIKAHLPGWCTFIARDPVSLHRFTAAVIDMEKYRAELAISIGVSEAVVHPPNPLRLRPPVYRVLKVLADSKMILTIEDIAGQAGCPKAEKTIRNILKELFAKKYADRPERYGVQITALGMSVL